MKTENSKDLMSVVADAVAKLVVNTTVIAVERALDARGLTGNRAPQRMSTLNGNGVHNGVHGSARHRDPDGVAKNGLLTPAQQKTLVLMAKFNHGNGGSIFDTSRNAPHTVSRVANNLARSGMIKLHGDSEFVLTPKGKLQADNK